MAETARLERAFATSYYDYDIRSVTRLRPQFGSCRWIRTSHGLINSQVHTPSALRRKINARISTHRENYWRAPRDLNPQALRHWSQSPARLPFRHTPVFVWLPEMDSNHRLLSQSQPSLATRRSSTTMVGLKGIEPFCEVCRTPAQPLSHRP